MILLAYVVEVFDLPYGDRDRHGAVDLVDRGLASAALVHRNLFRHSVLTLSKNTWRRPGHGVHSAEIDGLSCLVRGAVEVLLDTLDLDVHFIYLPARPDRPLCSRDNFSISGRNLIAHWLTVEW